MNSKFKYLSSLFFILVSGVFCWFAFKDVEYAKMKQIFKSVPIGLVILSMLFGYLAYIFFYNPDAFPIFSKIPKFFVKFLFNFDKLISRIFFINKLSFATISVYKKNKY